MRLGVHLSIKNGFNGALHEALKLECDGFQMFAGNPRGWARKPIDSAEFENFRNERKQTAIWPVVIHLSYLPNPASDDRNLYEKSVLTLAEDFRRANQLGADFFVFHPGKAKGASLEEASTRVADAVNRVLAEVSGPTILLFENQSGAGTEIAAKFEWLGVLLKKVNEPDRTGVCWDTCHAFAAGYQLDNSAGWEEALAEFDHHVGMSFLKLFHLNDSMGKVGSGLDRHQHIGAGEIGLNGFEYLVNHPILGKLPGILETPQQNQGDDLKNLATLRRLAGSVS